MSAASAADRDALLKWNVVTDESGKAPNRRVRVLDLFPAPTPLMPCQS